VGIEELRGNSTIITIVVLLLLGFLYVRRVSISITDVDEFYTYAEFYGVAEQIEDDPNGAFFNMFEIKTPCTDHYS
jgi:hypothetical protein